MSLGFILIISFFFIGDLIAWLLAWRWLKHYASNRYIRWALHAFFAIQSAYSLALLSIVILAPMFSRRSLDWIPNPLQALIYIWHIIFLPLAMLTWTGAACVLAGRRLASRLVSLRKPAPARPDPGISRRSLLLASVAAIPPLLTLGATGYGLTQTWKFRINRLALPLAGLPPGLDGLRIAQVSDLHVGRWSTPDFLQNVIQATNSLNADLVVFTGDLIDISIEDLPRALDVYRQFRSRYGSAMIEGNHDLIDNPAAFRSATTDPALRMLRNSAFTIEHNQTPLQILGTPWSRGDESMRNDINAVSALRDRSAYPILLAHHPHAFDPAADAGFPLTLSGHTHGGLLAINRNISAGNLMFRYISGLYTRGDSKLLVSNGTGNWFPLRINAPAEIIEITLRRA